MTAHLNMKQWRLLVILLTVLSPPSVQRTAARPGSTLCETTKFMSLVTWSDIIFKAKLTAFWKLGLSKLVLNGFQALTFLKLYNIFLQTCSILITKGFFAQGIVTFWHILSENIFRVLKNQKKYIFYHTSPKCHDFIENLFFGNFWDFLTNVRWVLYLGHL